MMTSSRCPSRVRAVLASVVALLLLAGCAGPEKLRGQLRYGMEASPEGKQIHFPPPPSPPRFAYAGELIGEGNFFYETPEKGFGEKLLEFLTGVQDKPAIAELKRPQAVVTDVAGRVLVTDAGQSAVFVFDTVDGEARLIRESFGGRPFVSPSGIAAGPDGMFFVADAGAGYLARIKASGQTYPVFGEGQLSRPTGVAFDPARKRVFVADTAEDKVKAFDLQGRLDMTIGRSGTAEGEFNRPTHLATWRNELYVSDTFNARIQVFDLETGAFIRTFGNRGTFVGQLAIPKGVAVDSEGNVYVIESLHDHLLVFDRQGRFLLPIGGTGYGTGSFYLPAGLWVDEGNRIYVADMFNGRVVTYLYLGSESEGDD